MASEQQWRQKSDRELASHLGPLLTEAYGTLPSNEAWLEQLVHTVRGEMEAPADAVPLAAWALADEVFPSEEAAAALEGEATRPVLVRLVAELARIVLLDEPTATHILRHLQRYFEEERGWPAAQVKAPIRAALTGRHDGPPLPAVMALLGRERCMRRIAASLR
jgi:glutamyl/glutaminyl-tRNA synthetase